MIKTLCFLVLLSTCISGQYLTILGANILAGLNGGIPGVVDTLINFPKEELAQWKQALSKRSLIDDGLGHVFDVVDQIKLGVGTVGNKVNDEVTKVQNAYHYDVKSTILITQLDLALKQLHFFYTRGQPVPQSIYDRILSLATQVDDSARESIAGKTAHIGTLTARLGDTLTTGADATADTNSVIDAADDIAQDVKYVMTGGCDQLAQLSQELTELARNGSQSAVKIALGLKEAAERSAHSIYGNLQSIRQQLVANEQAVQRALSDAPIGDCKDRLTAADQRLVKEIAFYDELTKGVAKVYATEGQNRTERDVSGSIKQLIDYNNFYRNQNKGQTLPHPGK